MKPQPTVPPLRVVFAISSLAGGGAERVATRLACGWAERGHHVTFVTLSDDEAAYPSSPLVERRALGLTQSPRNKWEAARNNLQVLAALRCAIGDLAPDVVVSFIDTFNVTVLAATMGTGIPVVVSERVDPRHHDIGPVWRLLRRALYRRAAAIVVQTEAVRTWAQHHAGASTEVAVLANPVDLAAARTTLRPRGVRQRILAAGRLTEQKGFDLLIRAFAEVCVRHPSWDVIILGEGPVRRELQDQIDAGGLGDRVTLVGWVPEIEAEMRNSDIFVLSSRYEGFPNVLLEAMAVGLPVISFDCPSGPSEIIRHGYDGRLVPVGDVSALASALEELIRDPLLRESLGAGAHRRSRDFAHESVLTQWENLLSSVVNAAQSSR